MCSVFRCKDFSREIKAPECNPYNLLFQHALYDITCYILSIGICLGVVNVQTCQLRLGTTSTQCPVVKHVELSCGYGLLSCMPYMLLDLTISFVSRVCMYI